MLQALPVGFRRFAHDHVDFLAWTLWPIGDQRQVDDTVGRLQQAVYDGHVAFVDLPGLKQSGKPALHLQVSGKKHQAARRLVQAVHQQCLGPNGLQARQQAILLVGASSGNRQQASWLFHNEQVIVLKTYRRCEN